MSPSAPSSATQEDRLLAVAQELYALRPVEFTQARNTRAKEVRADGGADLSRAVQALPKPAVSAWTVNLMVRHMGDQLNDVLQLGAELRQAQEDLDAARMRDLNRQRRRLTDAVAQQGRRLAGDLGQKLPPSAVGQVSATLHAAMTDEDAEAALRTGLLVQPMTATGLAPVDLDGVLAVPEALGRAAPRASGGKKTVPMRTSRAAEARRRAEEQAREELGEAERQAQAAEHSAAQAQQRLDEAEKHTGQVQAQALRLTAELEELRRQVDEREFALDRVRDELEEAEAQRDAARAAQQDATALAAEVQQEVTRLREQLGAGRRR